VIEYHQRANTKAASKKLLLRRLGGLKDGVFSSAVFRFALQSSAMQNARERDAESQVAFSRPWIAAADAVANFVK
jgi:hypothetical protein